jgi:hypothetical protein
MMRRARRLLPALLALAAAAALTACGSDQSTTRATDTAPEAETVSGQFEPLPDAPAGYSNLSGEAELTRASGGTTVSLSLTGLEPRTAYVAHLHTGACDQADPGGPHFQFEKGGSSEPPNEIHLEFASDAAGDGEARASSTREVPVGEAGSVVLHLGEEQQVMAAFVHEGKHDDEDDEGDHPQSDKLACADLESVAAGAGEAGDGSAAAGPVPTIVVRDGEPVGGVEELEFDADEEVRFRVSSDAAEEVHVHGYDIAKDVPAGGTVEFAFPADIEGIFEAELEELGVQILELRVNP